MHSISKLSSSQQTMPTGFFKDLLVLAAAAALFAILIPDGITADDPEKQRVRIAFEISGDASSHEASVAKVESAKRNIQQRAEITVVATSEGARLLLADDNALERRLASLADQGVDFVVCEESLAAMETGPGGLVGFARLVRSGEEELERLEKLGWARVPDGESYVSNL